jgi:hypothetical protein
MALPAHHDSAERRLDADDIDQVLEPGKVAVVAAGDSSVTSTPICQRARAFSRSGTLTPPDQAGSSDPGLAGDV